MRQGAERASTHGGSDMKTSMNWNRYAAWGLSLVFGAFLTACGGGASRGGVANDIGVTLSTAGSSTTVAPGDRLTIKANVTNTTRNPEVIWSLSGPNCPSNCGRSHEPRRTSRTIRRHESHDSIRGHRHRLFGGGFNEVWVRQLDGPGLPGRTFHS